MGVTVNINGLSLCHKGSTGVVMATVPDVCKTPAPGGPVPIPYPNIAFSRDLAKGTKKVKADGGQSCAIKGSEFSKSTGDEPGTVGGVKSGVNMHKATWLSWSPDVFLEGKPAARLTDKMLLNKGNTVSMGGELQPPVLGQGDPVEELCRMACECKGATGGFQRCVDKKIKEKYYDGDYPKPDSPIWKEVSMTEGPNGWDIIKNVAGNAPTSFSMTPYGGIRPDIVLTNGAGTPTQIIEMKFPNDTLRSTQVDGGFYDDAANDLGVDYKRINVETTCNFCWDPPPPGDPVTVDDGYTTGQKVGIGAVVVVGGLAIGACYVTGPCTVASIVAALGLGGSAAMVTQ